MRFTKLLAAAAVALVSTVGSALAATVDFEITFSTIPIPGFTVTTYNPSSPLATPSNCGSPCALLSNNQTLQFTLIGPGTFDVTSFSFNGTGSDDGAFKVSTTLDGSGPTFTESQNGNTMSTAFPIGFTGLTTIFFKNVGNGSSRLDTIKGTITTDDNNPPNPVPLPAAGLLLVGGLAPLVVMRRRRKA